MGTEIPVGVDEGWGVGVGWRRWGMVGGGVVEEGKLFHHHSNSCHSKPITMGRDESHFKVPLIVRGKI